MSRLINRKAASRIECLHSLMQLLNEEFPAESNFSMNDAKYDSSKKNIFGFCPLLLTHEGLGFSYCPYKQNPLDKSACGLTNSVDLDSTKQKEVSNTLNALEGLGFLNRAANSFSVSTHGKLFAETAIDSAEMAGIFRSACLRYGPFVGMLAQLHIHDADEISSDDIFVGYPKTEETAYFEGSIVRLSVDSAGDSDVRTKSCLVLWAIASGILFDKRLGLTSKPQIDNREILNAPTRSIRKLGINKPLVSEIISFKKFTERPLDYKNLTKNVGSLRENNQSVQREITMQLDALVKNRRLAICWALSKSAEMNRPLVVSDLTNILCKEPTLFVVSEEEMSSTILQECMIAFAAGIPYAVGKDGSLEAFCSIDLEVLSQGAPIGVIDFLEKSF